MNCGVYEILNTSTGKRYVGSSVDVQKRFRAHRQRARLGTHHSIAFQRAWDKYSEHAFQFNLVLVCAPRNLLLYEQLTFAALRPEYNTEKVAGSKLGTKHTMETRAKMSRTRVGKPRPPFSAKHRANISASRRLRVTKPETRAKLSVAAKGRVLSAEHKAKIAAANSGKQRSPEHVAAMRLARWGRA